MLTLENQIDNLTCVLTVETDAHLSYTTMLKVDTQLTAVASFICTYSSCPILDFGVLRSIRYNYV